jgi:hypothetical protein
MHSKTAIKFIEKFIIYPKTETKYGILESGQHNIIRVDYTSVA